MKPVAMCSEPSTNLIQRSTPQTRGRYSTWISTAARKTGTFVLGVLAIYAASSIPGADAGPAAYTACVAACGGLPWCWPACWPMMFIPGP
jgi:hypothetical protein